MISAEEFLLGLSSAGILPDEIVQEVRQSAGGQTAVQLADRLAGEGHISSYQRHEMLQGRWGKLSLAGYLLLDRIGEGGMGEVYLALHRQMQRRVAIKLLLQGAAESAESVERFRREIRIVARLSHPNIVAAYDAGEDKGMLYLVMEYVEGETLHALVKRRGPLPIDEAVGYLVQAACGLKAAHAGGIVHRDVKPANLLRDRDGAVKILDLGLARLIGPARSRIDVRDGVTLTRSDQILGTVDYMAPEQACSGRPVDHRVDIYSLGCCFHFFLTGRPAYDGSSLVDCLVAHRDADIPSLRAARPELPEALDAAFRRMVAKRPEDRYGAMEELLEALGAAEASLARSEETRRDAAPASLEAIAPFVPPVTPPAPAARAEFGKRKRRVRPVVVALAMVVVAATALGAFAWIARGLGWLDGKPVATDEVKEGDDAMAANATTLIAASPALAMRGHTNTIECLAFIPGGNRIISGDDDQRILVWDLTAGRLQFELAKGNDSGPCLAVAPNGPLAATASNGDVLRVWDLSSQKEVKRLAGHHVTFSPTGKLVAAALKDDSLVLYDTADWKEIGVLVGHTCWVQAMAFSADGRTLASGDESGFLRVWDVEARSERFNLENGSYVHELVLTRDGSLAAAVCDDGSLRMWNLGERRLQWKVQAHQGKALRLALSPDQTRLASSGGDGTIALWDVGSARPLARWRAHRDDSVAVAFSPDGKRLASGGDDTFVKLWNVESLVPPSSASGGAKVP